MKDFLHSNSPYLKTYIQPAVREPREIDSVSLDTDEDMFSPSLPRLPTQGLPRQITKLGESSNHQHQSLNIDQFDTNAPYQNQSLADFEPTTSSEDGDDSNDSREPDPPTLHQPHVKPPLPNDDEPTREDTIVVPYTALVDPQPQLRQLQPEVGDLSQPGAPLEAEP